jgi:hypothetical protein
MNIDKEADALKQVGQEQRHHVDVNMGLYRPFLVSYHITLSTLPPLAEDLGPEYKRRTSTKSNSNRTADIDRTPDWLEN